jgi:hypothetical protein
MLRFANVNPASSCVYERGDLMLVHAKMLDIHVLLRVMNEEVKVVSTEEAL